MLLFALAVTSLGIVPVLAVRAETYYVRVDGGDASQCTGRSNAPYPGSGTAQACAWNHIFQALAPDGTRRIAGGDTLRIGSGSYMIGQGAPGAGSCLPATCSPASIPSGSVGAPTRILGEASAPPKLWGTLGVTRMLSLDGSSNVEIGHLEITDQDDCVYSHSNAAVKCPAVGSGTWGKHGVYARASSNVWLHDLDIHGLGHTGLWAGGLTDWTIERVRLHHNGRAGWDANIGTGSSNAGRIILRNVEVGWNGCGERWQTGETWACWGAQTGGYGDGLGTITTGGEWLIEDSYFHHNTQDGLDLRFLDGASTTQATLRRIHAVGNAGNQVKVKGNALIENSVLIGNCGYFSGLFYMVAADQCRADGTTLLLVFTSDDNVVVRHNTITGEGWSLVGATEGDASGRLLVQNNVLTGFPWFLGPSNLSRVQAGNSPALVTHAGNLVWNVYGNACPGDSLCGVDPRLANMTLATFDAEPLTDSPVADRVAPLAEVNRDFLLRPRPAGPASDIGAYELPVGTACARAAPAVLLSGSSEAVPAGTAQDYTLSLGNHDSAACAATQFNLAGLLPAGWSGAFAAATLTLAPGAEDSTTFTVTSPANATAGAYAVGVNTGSSAGAVHATSSASASYTVAPLVPVCTRNTPIMSLTGPTAEVPAGTRVEYTVGLANNDSSACASTDFSLADSVPAGWSGTLATTILTLAPGASDSTTLAVASPATATPGGYGIGVGAGSNAGAVHTASANTTYRVETPAPACTRATPTLALNGPTTAVTAGSPIDYTLDLTNNDSASCASTNFSLSGSVPSGWSASLAISSLALAPGASGSTTLTVTSDARAAPGGYAIGVGAGSSVGTTHTASASATYSVDTPPPPCTRVAPTLAVVGPTTPLNAGTAVDYTVTLANNDSGSCASTTFSLARSVPAGWSGTLAASSLALAPGASGSTTLTVASDTSAAPGGYAIGVGVGSSAGAVHTANASATYTVDTPPPPCTRAAPTLSVTGPGTPVPAGTAVDYTVALANNDSSTCATSGFSLAGSVPAGWTGTLTAASLNLAPGANGSTTLRVTSATNATAGSYTIGAGVGSSAGAVHTVNATTIYAVEAPPPVCTRAAPTLGLSGPTTAVAAGTAVDYTASVVNNDSAACATTSFALARAVPAGWTGTLAATSLGLAPGATGSTTLRVTSTTTAAAGNYTVSVGTSSSVGAVHAVNASTTYSVAPPAINLQTTLGTDRTTYARRDTVQIAALLRNNGVPVPGVVVTFTLARPGAGSTTLTATSGSDGYARTSYKIPNAKSALGAYTVTARWALGGVNATAVTASFTVL
ncbi:NEW3 domain-containing protein [Lysobacter solisilvae (ex Woo and Kim 2020)]|uniref:Big-1 domain-containing protein n=1 Tax=Agrilutibacter terrestris TaxID=2865112 RepID=A0A7H0FWX9_9GAMM|nr:NEW3 domain-containing protein [Lysobacter terrestris]QNP40545.1 hypothetical protein H8B22_13930 [Lysobacter terrestris]